MISSPPSRLKRTESNSCGGNESTRASRRSTIAVSGECVVTGRLLDAQDLLVDRKIVVGEGRRAKASLNVRAAAPGVDPVHPVHGCNHAVQVVNDEAGLP